MKKVRVMNNLYSKAEECHNVVEMLRNMAFDYKLSREEENQLLNTADMIRKKEDTYRRQADEIEKNIFIYMI